ncbi:MAG: hypothetical protein IJ193_08360 [Bacilli bacterium]|nr:hypothetical protein [Bacilli bacterium]
MTGDLTISKTDGATLTITSGAGAINKNAGSIYFRGSTAYDANGFLITSEAQGSCGRQSLNFYSSNNTNGGSGTYPAI